MSNAAETYIIGSQNTPPTFPGDGLVPGWRQVFTQLPGFSGVKMPRLIVRDHDVIHTGAPLQTDDLNLELFRLMPDWFQVVDLNLNL